MPSIHSPPPPYGQYPPSPYSVFKTELLEKHNKLKHHESHY